MSDELERRLASGAALLKAGRLAEGIEIYRSVAIAYRDHGMTKQAIAVCHAVLDVAPADPVSRGMLAALGEPERRSSGALTNDRTPLPAPLPYHVADPTRQIRKASEPGVGNAETQPAVIPTDELTPVTLPIALVDLDDVVTPYVREDGGRDSELPDVTNPNIQVTTTSQRLIAGALFWTIAPYLPRETREAMLEGIRTNPIVVGATDTVGTTN